MHTVNANIVMTMRLGDDNDVCLINRNSCIALANMQLSIWNQKKWTFVRVAKRAQEWKFRNSDD